MHHAQIQVGPCDERPDAPFDLGALLDRERRKWRFQRDGAQLVRYLWRRCVRHVLRESLPLRPGAARGCLLRFIEVLRRLGLLPGALQGEGKLIVNAADSGLVGRWRNSERERSTEGDDGVHWTIQGELAASQIIESLGRRRLGFGCNGEMRKRFGRTLRFDKGHAQSQIRRRIARRERQLRAEFRNRLLHSKNAFIQERQRTEVIVRTARSRVLLQRALERCAGAIVKTIIAIRTADEHIGFRSGPCLFHRGEQRGGSIGLSCAQVRGRKCERQLRVLRVGGTRLFERLDGLCRLPVCRLCLREQSPYPGIVRRAAGEAGQNRHRLGGFPHLQVHEGKCLQRRVRINRRCGGLPECFARLRILPPRDMQMAKDHPGIQERSAILTFRAVQLVFAEAGFRRGNQAIERRNRIRRAVRSRTSSRLCRCLARRQ